MSGRRVSALAGGGISSHGIHMYTTKFTIELEVRVVHDH